MKTGVNIISKEAVAKGAGRYVVGNVQPFDQKNEMFKRPLWDESVADLGRKYYGLWEPQEDRPGYGFLDQAFKNATYYIDFAFAHGMFGGRWGFMPGRANPGGKTSNLRD